MRPGIGRILVAALLLVSAALAVMLWRLRQNAAERLRSAPAVTTLPAPPGGTPANVTLMLANDADGSLVEQHSTVTLPEEPSARARILLNQLLARYAEPGSSHPVAPNPGVDAVFFLALPSASGTTPAPRGTLAVVSLSGAFAAAHPSGIEPETLTLLSIMSTLHTNMPDIAEVRFLIDGEPRATLAGHADLTHTYLAGTASAPVPETPETAGATGASR